MIEITPRDAEVYYNRGNTKIHIKDYQGAISDYTKAIEINPQFDLAYKNRGITLEQLGDLTGACTDWKKAAGLGDSEAAKWVRDQC